MVLTSLDWLNDAIHPGLTVSSTKWSPLACFDSLWSWILTYLTLAGSSSYPTSPWLSLNGLFLGVFVVLNVPSYPALVLLASEWFMPNYYDYVWFPIVSAFACLYIIAAFWSRWFLETCVWLCVVLNDAIWQKSDLLAGIYSSLGTISLFLNHLILSNFWVFFKKDIMTHHSCY